MTLMMDAEPGNKPKDTREAICPNGSTSLKDSFGDVFNTLHKSEIVACPPILKGSLPDSMYSMTGFDPGSEQGVLMSKKYDKALDQYTHETTTIELRHTPQQ
jgi:hypothetical protein